MTAPPSPPCPDIAALTGLDRSGTGPDMLPIAGELALAQGRVHEFCGPARRVLAVWAMAALPAGAPVMWLHPKWERDRICPQGLIDWACPSGLILMACPRERDLLACAEDCLRSGAAELVVVELPKPPALTPVRRLHLAAEEGRARRKDAARTQPRPAQGGGAMDQAGSANGLGLLLTPHDGGAQAVESRWHLAPRPAPPQARMAVEGPQPCWHLRRLRARMAPPAAWQVRLNRQPDQWDIALGAGNDHDEQDTGASVSGLPLAFCALPQA